VVAELGALKRIDAREIWKHEALDFTPWLRDHIGLLGDALGLELDLVEAEVPVGPFAADLVAKDVSNDRWVVIENQLAPTDHSHLGQLLTYGAGTQTPASVFVWISPEFRDEHRAALDWLNEHSDENSWFFGVAIELLAVDDSLPAPNFRLVSSPNEWEKSGAVHTSPRTAAYAQFFGDVLKAYKGAYPGDTHVSGTARHVRRSWFGLTIGKTGFRTNWAFTIDKRFRVQLYIDCGEETSNKSYFDQLCRHRSEVESEMGHGLEWNRLDGSRACTIISYYAESPISVLDGPAVLEAIKQWAVPEMKSIRDTFRPLVAGLRDLDADSAEDSDDE
jgi:hypothetical protein